MEPTHGAGDERPVEHVPITVYWQRRAVAGLLVVALVAALAFAVTSWRQRAAAAGAEAVLTTSVGTPPSGSAGAAPAPGADASPTGAATPGSADTASTAPGSATTDDAPAVTCDVAQLVLRVSGPARVAAGAQANLVVTFTNVGADECWLPLSPETFELAITSGSDRIWASSDCAGWGPESVTAVGAGQTLEWTKVWDRHRSTKCKVSADDLLPGTYVATATWRGGPSARHVMTLTW